MCRCILRCSAGHHIRAGEGQCPAATALLRATQLTRPGNNTYCSIFDQTALVCLKVTLHSKSVHCINASIRQPTWSMGGTLFFAGQIDGSHKPRRCSDIAAQPCWSCRLRWCVLLRCLACFIRTVRPRDGGLLGQGGHS